MKRLPNYNYLEFQFFSSIFPSDIIPYYAAGVRIVELQT